MKNKIEVEFSIEAVKVAAQNCESLDKMALQLGVINPKTLNIDDRMWGFTSLPINDKIDTKEIVPSTLRYIALRSIIVDSLAKDDENKCIVVNGDIDLPYENGKIVGLDETFIQNEKVAREIASFLTDFSLERAMEGEEFYSKSVAFLKEQKKEQRF